MTAPRPTGDADAARARLLAWAEAMDARTLKARSSGGAIVTGGALAVLGGMALARAVMPMRRSLAGGAGPARAALVGWPMVVRGAVWLLPHALSALRSVRRPPAQG